MKVGSGHSSILRVEELYPGVQLLQVLEVVDKVRGWGAITFEPYKFGWVEDSSNSEFILNLGVIGILPVNDLFQVHEPLNQGVPGSTLEDVVKTSTNEDPHGSGLPLVLHMEGVGEVAYGPPRDSVPLNMKGIRATYDARISWMVNSVQLAITQNNIHATVEPGAVEVHAGGAHVGVVAARVLNACHNAHLSGREVVVVEWARPSLKLPVATNAAVRGHPCQHWVGTAWLARELS